MPEVGVIETGEAGMVKEAGVVRTVIQFLTGRPQ